MLSLYEEIGLRPRYGVWELTPRCNLGCLHCASRAARAQDDELTFEELLGLANELIALGSERITLSGGEPLLRVEWPDLTRHLVDGGVTVNMISNGYRFDEKTLKLAVSSGLAGICLSLDGDEPVHTKIRRHPDAFRRVLRTLDLCADGDLPATVSTTVCDANVHLLDDMAKLLLDYKVRTWQLQLGFDAGDLGRHPGRLISPDALRDMVPKIARLKSKLADRLRVDVGHGIGYFTDEDRILRAGGDLGNFWLGCPAGLQSVGIEANGNVKGCLNMRDDRFIEGNVREESLEAIWNKPGNFAYTRDFSVENLGGFCRTCRYNAYCRGGCSWNAFLHGQGTGKLANSQCLYQIGALSGPTPSDEMHTDCEGS